MSSFLLFSGHIWFLFFSSNMTTWPTTANTRVSLKYVQNNDKKSKQGEVMMYSTLYRPHFHYMMVILISRSHKINNLRLDIVTGPKRDQVHIYFDR
ncbi:hypothetical protein B0H66DRAFT_344026 [Apodospora peruviana]|uniref:Secreted protein n=1 Tax=Apodospora peruviana TaxID=516989 RepID=A0AAE0HYV2_9PEZI|nr:hypothetical protein B0H66DRAFT_344026 [Apodospora peruviana]